MERYLPSTSVNTVSRASSKWPWLHIPSYLRKLHECHESQPSNFPCSNTWATHENRHTLPNIVLQLFLGAEMALRTLCGPWLSGPSCSSQASRKLFDLVWSILKHFWEWEKNMIHRDINLAFSDISTVLLLTPTCCQGPPNSSLQYSFRCHWDRTVYQRVGSDGNDV